MWKIIKKIAKKVEKVSVVGAVVCLVLGCTFGLVSVVSSLPNTNWTGV